MTERLRIGLIGAGMMGREHIRNLKLLPDAQVAAIADPDEGSRALAVQTLGEAADGIAVHAPPEALLAAGGLDAVLIASPNHTHRAVLEAAFAHPDLHILCEKPLCTTVADAAWAAEQAARRRAVFWTGMEYRFMPPVARFVERAHAGEIGRLRMLSMREHRFPFLSKVGDWNRFAHNTVRLDP